MEKVKPCPFKGKFIIEVETSFETQETSDSVAYMLQEDFNESRVVNMAVWGVSKVVPFDQDTLWAENKRLKKALKEAEDRIFEWNDLSDEV
jgi:hypothetical protein